MKYQEKTKEELIREITDIQKENQQAQIELHRANQREVMLKKALEILHIGVTISDINGKIIYTNPAEAQMHGYQQDEVIGKDARIFATKEFGKPLEWKKILTMEKRIRETFNVTKEGKNFPVQLISDVIKDGVGEPIGIVTVSEDITQRKELEQALQETRGNFNHLMKISPYPILIHSPDRILNMNKKAIEIFRQTEEKLKNTSPEQIISSDFRKKWREWIAELIKGEALEKPFEVIIVGHSDKKISCEAFAELVQVEDKTAILTVFKIQK